MVKLIQLIIPCTIVTISSGTITGDDITTIAEFEAYNRMTRNICSGDDVSTCPKPSRSVCLNDYCYKTCTTDDNCAKNFMCSYENLCKPRGCHPCINGPTYPMTSSTTRDPDEDDEEPELDIDISTITTSDEWEEYLRKSDAYCPSGDVAECPRQKRRICLDGKCFKRCAQDTQCADGFTCNFEGLCKPANCTPCIRRTMYPTSAITMPIDELLDDEIVPDITTESEFDAYMARTRRVCPSGDVNECPVTRNRLCLNGKCFKQCSDDNDCGDKFVCNFENLCKPQKCTPCQRATYLPTPQPPSDELFDEMVPEIATESEFDAYMARTRRVCPSGDVNECPVTRNRICLAGKCFKKCGDDDDCGDKFVCNFENLCKPEKCIPCRRATYYPTPQPPSDDILAVMDNVEMDGKNQTFSTAMMISLTSFVGVIIFIFWICGGCMLWKNGDNIQKIGEYESFTKYGATASV